MKLEIAARKKLVYECLIPIRWGDMDAMGHVNNASYFRYMETARIDWFESIGIMSGPQDVGPVIVNAFCNFHRSFVYPGKVRVKVYVSDPGRTSFETWATLEPEAEPGVIFASGGATAVWTDMPKQKSVPLPEHVRALAQA